MPTSAQTLLAKIEQRRRHGESIASACRAIGIHSSTYYRWRLRERHEPERRGFSQAFDELSQTAELELAVLRSAMRTLPSRVRCEAATWAAARFGASPRQAAHAFGVRRKSLMTDTSTRSMDPFVVRLLQLARQNPTFGYRRVWAMLRREGWIVNHKRVYRLWRQYTLNKGLPRPRRRPRTPLIPSFSVATTPHECWSLDAIRCVTIDQRPVELLLVLDDYSRYCLALDAYPKIDHRAMKTTLERLFNGGFAPLKLRVDRTSLKLLRNGPELLAYIQVVCACGKSPARNPYAESFFSRFRVERLNKISLVDLSHAQRLADDWRHDCNHERPHSGIGYRSPAELLDIDDTHNR